MGIAVSSSSAVTGATGHLGNVLVRELCARGERPRAILQPGDDGAALAGLDVEVVFADVTDLQAMRRAFEGVQRVFHLAGVVSITAGQQARLQAINVGGTEVVVAACRHQGVERLVHMGSVHALTEPRSGVLTEEAGFDPALASGAYGQSKARACLTVQRAAKAGELDAVLVLPTGVVGPFDFRLSEVGQLLRDLVDERVPLLLPGGHDWVDVRDVALGTIAAAERGRRGEAYLLGGEYVTLRTLAQLVQAETGARVPALLPRWLARVVAAPAPLWERLTGHRALLTPYAVHAVSVNFRVSHQKAADELGFVPRPIATSVREALRWQASRVKTTRQVVRPGRAVAVHP